MMPTNNPRATAAELRAQAEAAFREKSAAQPDDFAAMSPDATRAMLHELQVHQIELELQNEELRRTQVSLDESRARYFDLYDLAPVGYCTVSGSGMILKSNLTLANLLGRPRSKLNNLPFFRIIAKEDQDQYYLLKKQILAAPAPGIAEPAARAHTCDLRLIQSDGKPIWVNLAATAVAKSTGHTDLRVVVTDITEQRTREAAERLEAQTRLEILNAIPAHVALVDPEGVILVTNESWRRFATANLLQGPEFSLGQNYLKVCERAIGPCSEEAKDAAAGIRRVLRGEVDEFTIEYPCHSPTEQRWFRLMVTPLREGLQAGAVVMHVNVTERKLAEVKIRESATLFRTMADSAPVLIWMAGLDKGCNYFNKVWLDFTGRTLAQEEGNGWAEGVHPEDVARCLKIYVDHFDTRQKFTMDYRLRRADGEFRWLTDTGMPRFDEAGVFLGYIGSCIDITERKEAESKLLLADRALKAVSQGVLITGPDQLIISVNVSFSAITGYSEPEILGKNCKFLAGPDTDPLTVVAIRQAIKNQTEFAGVILNYRKDGTPFWNDLTITPVFDAHGTLTQFVSVTRDVTDSKQAAKQLSESEMRMRLAIRGGDLGLWDWQVATGQLTVNEHWLSMLGLDAQTHRPTIELWHSLVHPEDLPKLDHLFKEVILNPAGCELEVEIRVRHKNGNYVWILDKGRVVERAPDGSPLRVVGTHLDITERKTAEAALLASQNLLLSITESTTDAMYVKDTQGRYLLLNAAASRYVGKPPEAVLGKDDTVLFPLDQAREIMEYDRQVMSSGLTQTYEGVELTTTVGPIRFLTSKGPIRNPQGEVIGIFGISRDITARKQAEIELRTSEARFRTLVEHSPNCIHEIDLAGRLTSMNKAGLKMLGVDDVCSIQGMPYLDAVRDADRKRIAGLLAEAFAGQASEFVFQTPNGQIFQSSFVPIADDGGTVQNLMGVTIDITERSKTEQLLLTNEAKFRAIIEASPVPMAINNEQKQITYLNPALMKTFGYDQNDIPTLADWWPKAYPDPVYRQWVTDAWQAELARAVETRTEFNPLELKIRCKDGTDRFVLANAAPLADGLEKTHLVILYDISERKRTEQDLKLAHEASNRAKSEFLANMSHEIRTPLTAILGFADILGEDETVHQTPLWRKQIVDTIKNAGAHLLAVINDILDLSKIEAEKLTVEKADTPLVELLGEVERLMHHTAAGKGLVLSMAISSHLPERILSDQTRLRQILVNLVGNAIKFTAEGSVRITAGVEHQDRQARLVIDIADTGPGMSPEQVLGLFKPFGQVDSTVTRKHGGTGLGLVISRRLAQIMGGDVTLLNTELGKGSCFRLVLPFEEVVDSTTITSLTPIQAKDEPQPIAVAVRLHGRVLLAEDGLDNQRLIAFVMRKAGATIETADNGRIALDMLDQAEARGMPFDLLLTDMQMPEMDGYNLASTLRGRGSKLPIIALTAHAMADDRKKCIDAGCDDYIAKPVNNAHLIAKCAEWMERHVGVK